MTALATIDVLGLTGAGFIAAAQLALPRGAGIAAELYARVFRSGCFAPEDFTLAAASLAAWRATFSCGLLTVKRVVEEDNASDLTAKAVLATSDGAEIKVVRIPMRDGEYTLCLSSQVGCRMGCTFCETGRMGLLRNLSAAEIVSQVLTVQARLGWTPRNLAFMGMGEALDNADHVIQALRVLSDQRGLHDSQERLTVCTAGHAEGLAKLAALGWQRLNLSISLNAPEDARRDRLMRVNRRTPPSELSRILAAYPQRRNFTLGVNYCLLPGFNDAEADAHLVAEFRRPLGRVLVNLIPYNPGSTPLTRAPSEDETVRSIGWPRAAGVPVRRRVTKGRSIMAACGQLGNGALRRRAPAAGVSA